MGVEEYDLIEEVVEALNRGRTLRGTCLASLRAPCGLRGDVVCWRPLHWRFSGLSGSGELLRFSVLVLVCDVISWCGNIFSKKLGCIVFAIASH